MNNRIIIEKTGSEPFRAGLVSVTGNGQIPSIKIPL